MKILKDNKISPTRQALIRLSNSIRQAQKQGLLPPEFDDCETLNDCLRRTYELETGQSEWDTYHGWRERGYYIEKGARGFPVWSRPKGKDKEAENEAEGNERKEPKSFWVAYIFHAGQVLSKANLTRPAEYIARKPLALPLPAEYEQEAGIISGRLNSIDIDPEIEVLPKVSDFISAEEESKIDPEFAQLTFF